MAMKEWFRRMQPVQLYVILLLTIAFFITELIVSHLTHALTLLMDSYHMLCNIIALSGCLITMKYSKEAQNEDQTLKKAQSKASSVGEELTSNPTMCHDKKKTKSSVTRDNQERKLKNTFGWARIDVIVMLICCVFLASLSFSILVEALQTLVHIDHHDEMHHPISVLCIGAAGLLLNGICYLLIGGYTFHQGSFLYVTESGDVVLNKVVVNQSIQHGDRRLSRTKYIHSTVLPPKKRQGLWEMMRDVNGCILVMICALIIFFTEEDVAKYIDPALSMVSVTSIMTLSYPYMKESCLILLQTMPDTIDIDILKAQLLNHFPDIVNVHDFHVWQLTANKVISTVHIIFQNPKIYQKIVEDVEEFFSDHGITQVTIQPEFFTKSSSADSLTSSKFASNCLMPCQGEVCKQSHCCPDYEEGKGPFRSSSKEVLPSNTTPDLKSVKILTDEHCSNINTITSYPLNIKGDTVSGDQVSEDLNKESRKKIENIQSPDESVREKVNEDTHKSKYEEFSKKEEKIQSDVISIQQKCVDEIEDGDLNESRDEDAIVAKNENPEDLRNKIEKVDLH